MDMTDLNRAPVATAATAQADPPAVEPDHWRDVVGEMSAEIAGPLTAALERVQTLVSTGRIDRSSLRSLNDEIQLARQISMSGQQIARLASGRLRQTHERLALTDTLKDVLTQRARETQARGIHIKQVLRPAEVVVDPSLLFSLLNTLVSWSMDHARSNIEFRIDIKTWPAHARLATRFAYRPVDQLVEAADDDARRVALDAMTWRVIEQTAWTMGLPIERRIEGHEVQLSIEFPRTVNDQIEGVSAIELDQGFSPSLHA